MKTSFINLRKRYRIPSPPRLETGFSMLEAVVVVGVLLALAVGGFFAFGPITENAKIAKVRSAASEVHTGVLVASMDGDSNTTPEKVITDWNGRNDKIKVAIVGSEGSGGDFCVSAENIASPHITHQTGACVPGSGSGTPEGSNPDTDGDGIPDATDPDIDGDGTPNASDTTPNGENAANPGSDTVVDDGSGSTEPASGGVVAASTWSTPQAITNLYPDPGFKSGVNGWTPHGVLNYPNDANIATISYGTGAPGDPGGLQFSATGTADTYRTTVYFPMDTKDSKHLSFLISSATGKWDPNASWHAGFVHTDINGEYVSSDGGNAVSVGDAGVFSRYSYESSMWKGDTIANSYLFIQATHLPAGQTVTLNVDRMYAAGGPTCVPIYCSPIDAPSVPNYEPNFDGSYPANFDLTYRWLGAENASRSVATSTKRIAAPSTAVKGDIIEVKGEGYAPNSTATPVFHTGSWPGSGDFRGNPVQTDSSGKFATTVNLGSLAPFNYKVSVAEDPGWATVDMTVTGPPISDADAPGPWTKREGTTQEMSVASVIKKGTTITVMGRGYLPGTRLNVYDSYENYNWVQTIVDDNGYYSVQLPVSTNNGTVGQVEVWNNSLGSFYVDVTYE